MPMSMKLPVVLVVLPLIAAQSALAAAGPPPAGPNDTSYEGLVRIANQICVAPIEYGGGMAIGGEAKIGTKAALSRIISKLIGVNLSGSLKASGTTWYGVLQKDLAQAQISRNACAERVFDHLFDIFHISDKNTLKVVSKPSNISSVYRRINDRIVSSAVSTATTIENGSGVQALVSGNNNTFLNGNNNIINENIKNNRSHYIKMLQEVFIRGSEIYSEIKNATLSNDVVDKNYKEYLDWANSSGDRIRSEMTEAAVSKFYVIKSTSTRFLISPTEKPPLSSESIDKFNFLMVVYPQLLDNVQYLMEHDTMDPQNAGN
jgi:hypothetical protein